MSFEWIIDSPSGTLDVGRGREISVPSHGFAFRWDEGSKVCTLHVCTGQTDHHGGRVCDYCPPLTVEMVDRMLEVLWRFRLESMGL